MAAPKSRSVAEQVAEQAHPDLQEVTLSEAPLPAPADPKMGSDPSRQSPTPPVFHWGDSRSEQVAEQAHPDLQEVTLSEAALPAPVDPKMGSDPSRQSPTPPVFHWGDSRFSFPKHRPKVPTFWIPVSPACLK